ncbi:MAG: phytanoyl-CoA dioxygenase family protein [Geminicoccaceae bacterium]
MGLSADEIGRYRQDGFLVLEGFIEQQHCDALRARMAELMAGFDPAGIRTVFATNDQAHARDDWFLDSGDKIRFFFEPDSFNESGELLQPLELSLNKVGHALHDLDPVFDGFSRDPRFAAVARATGLVEPLLLQSMYIFKQPRIGAEVGCHQDSSFLYTQPLSCIGFWIALEDADETNGCMWAEPGGHHRPLHRRFVREGRRTRMETLDPAPLPEAGLVPLRAPKGSLVLLHGQLPHRSGPNRSDRSRHAYALHLIDGRCRYSSDNWLQRSGELPLRGF